MTSLQDHRFSPAYLLLCGRSIHQYTLQDSHFCSQGSAITSSSNSGRETWIKIIFSIIGNKKNSSSNLQKGPPSSNIRLCQENLEIVKEGKKTKVMVNSQLFNHFDGHTINLILNARNHSLSVVALERASCFHIGHLLDWVAHLMNHLHNCIMYVILKAPLEIQGTT